MSCRAACASASPSPRRLLTDPGLLIADEPTTALDVTMEAQIIHLLLYRSITFQHAPY